VEYGFSCMGYEVAAAVGVKMAEPNLEVYVLVGDGSFNMLHSEFITSLQEDLKINVILIDNHGFQCIHNLQRNQGIPSFGNEYRRREASTERLTGEYLPIDYAMVARGYGGSGYTATTVEEIEKYFKEMSESKVSSLIDIKTLPGTMMTATTRGGESESLRNRSMLPWKLRLETSRPTWIQARKY
jgi:3D-(3,5/4)-trihydroxycyclohexane-1,2-dione acylhydrolase (decyclizing)